MHIKNNVLRRYRVWRDFVGKNKQPNEAKRMKKITAESTHHITAGVN